MIQMKTSTVPLGKPNFHAMLRRLRERLAEDDGESAQNVMNTGAGPPNEDKPTLQPVQPLSERGREHKRP